MNNLDEYFWNASVAELKQGYVVDLAANRFICLVCGESTEQGLIYRHQEKLVDAKKAIEYHLALNHPPLAEYLLHLDRKVTGISDVQRDLLLYSVKGLSDREIAAKTGTSTSTVRNHRFNLRQKEKQARIFQALMELIREGKPEGAQDFVQIHRTATLVDERFAITNQENEEILKAYFPEGPDKTLKSFPRKEKKKVAILRHIAGKFSIGRTYTEKEVNQIIKKIYPDYVTLRRYLIEYGFLDREKDGSSYWVKK